MRKLTLLYVITVSVFATLGCQSIGLRWGTFNLDVTIPIPIPIPYPIEDTDNDFTAPHKVQYSQEAETSTEKDLYWLETDNVTKVYSKNID